MVPCSLLNVITAWGLPGVCLGSAWGLPEVYLGSAWGLPRVSLGFGHLSVSYKHFACTSSSSECCTFTYAYIGLGFCLGYGGGLSGVWQRSSGVLTALPALLCSARSYAFSSTRWLNAKCQNCCQTINTVLIVMCQMWTHRCATAGSHCTT